MNWGRLPITVRTFTGEAIGTGGAYVPFDAPGSVSFDGDNVIVTNESSLLNDSADWALLEIDVGEAGQPLSLPPVPPRHHPTRKRRHKRRR